MATSSRKFSLANVNQKAASTHHLAKHSRFRSYSAMKFRFRDNLKKIRNFSEQQIGVDQEINSDNYNLEVSRLANTLQNNKLRERNNFFMKLKGINRAREEVLDEASKAKKVIEKNLIISDAQMNRLVEEDLKLEEKLFADDQRYLKMGVLERVVWLKLRDRWKTRKMTGDFEKITEITLQDLKRIQDQIEKIKHDTKNNNRREKQDDIVSKKPLFKKNLVWAISKAAKNILVHQNVTKMMSFKGRKERDIEKKKLDKLRRKINNIYLKFSLTPDYEKLFNKKLKSSGSNIAPAAEHIDDYFIEEQLDKKLKPSLINTPIIAQEQILNGRMENPGLVKNLDRLGFEAVNEVARSYSAPATQVSRLMQISKENNRLEVNKQQLGYISAMRDKENTVLDDPAAINLLLRRTASMIGNIKIRSDYIKKRVTMTYHERMKSDARQIEKFYSRQHRERKDIEKPRFFTTKNVERPKATSPAKRNNIETSANNYYENELNKTILEIDSLKTDIVDIKRSNRRVNQTLDLYTIKKKLNVFDKIATEEVKRSVLEMHTRLRKNKNAEKLKSYICNAKNYLGASFNKII